MSAPFLIPFNFQPESISVKTSSYAIPAGKYAYVSVNVEGTGTFTISGATALRGTSHSVLAGSVLDYDSATHVGQNRMLVNESGGTNSGNAFSSDTVTTSITAHYWVPAGTTISGSGTWRATVSLYSNIS